MENELFIRIVIAVDCFLIGIYVSWWSAPMGKKKKNS